MDGQALAGPGPSGACRATPGTAEQLLETIGWTFPPGERATHDRAVAAVRDALGAEPYRKAYGEGAAMALDHAIEYAMQDEA